MKAIMILPIRFNYKKIMVATKHIELPDLSFENIKIKLWLTADINIEHKFNIDHVNMDSKEVVLKPDTHFGLDIVDFITVFDIATCSSKLEQDMKSIGWSVEVDQSNIDVLLAEKKAKETKLENQSNPTLAAAIIKKRLFQEWCYMVAFLALAHFIFQVYSHDWILSTDYLPDVIFSVLTISVVFALTSSVVFALLIFAKYKSQLKKLNKTLDNDREAGGE